MNGLPDNLFPSLPAACRRAVLLLALTLLLPGCVVSQAGYYELLAQAKTDAKGDEITGIWVTEYQNYGLKYTLLLNPDGTGRLRLYNNGRIKEDEPTWRYEGGGVWSLNNSNSANKSGLMRISGKHLLREGGGSREIFSKFVP